MEFDQIYTSFRPKIYRYLVKLAGSQDAEDLTQEVFAKVHKALGTFRNESQMSTWLYRIATNVAIDKMRTKSIKINPTDSNLIDGSDIIESKTYCLLEKSISLEDQVAHKEMNTCIQEIINQLPEKYRTVIILSELESIKNKEIAEILGISIESVKSRLHRGRIRLKSELLNHCDFSWDERNEFACDPKKQVIPKETGL